MQRVVFWIVLAFCSWCFLACGDTDTPLTDQTVSGDESSDASQNEIVVDDGPTYYGEIKALVDTHCVGCHFDGSVAPFPLETYDQMKAMSVAAQSAIEDGRMPPWMPDPDCRNYEGERLMTAEEIALFGAWVERGTPQGEPLEETTNAPPVSGELPDLEVTHVAVPLEPYIPDGELEDDYRCLPLDISFEEDMFLTASRVVPGDLSLVHHVLIYGVNEASGALLDAADAEEEGPGYSCFAGTEVSTPFPIGAWVPGIAPIIMEEGTAIHIPAGSRVVMQVHYNLISSEPSLDQTRWEVNLTTEEPENVVVSRPFINRTFEIPKNESNSVHTKEFINKTDSTWEVISVAPHMHLLGTRVTVEKLSDEQDDECLIDIPSWDFNWQQNFSFLSDETVFVAPGEGLRLTCEYDNSPENQPLVDGVQVESADVVWGDGTLDEMCLAFITTKKEFNGVPALCDPFNLCVSLCEGEEDFNCVVECMSTDVDCAWCLIPEIFAGGGCVDSQCTPQMEAVDGCFIDCAAGSLAAGGDVVGCMNEQCPAELEAIVECADPILMGGDCDSAMFSCNVFL